MNKELELKVNIMSRMAIIHFGHKHELMKFAEELFECGAALCRRAQSRCTNYDLTSELADVSITMRHAMNAFGITDEELEKEIQNKLKKMWKEL